VKVFTTTNTHHEVQMRADVGEIVHAHVESMRHRAQGAANGAIVLPEIPRAFGPATRKNDVHRPARAHRPFELAMMKSEIAAVLRSRKLGICLTPKKAQLNSIKLIIVSQRAMLSLGISSQFDRINGNRCDACVSSQACRQCGGAMLFGCRRRCPFSAGVEPEGALAGSSRRRFSAHASAPSPQGLRTLEPF
jgi:hypothetical protein